MATDPITPSAHPVKDQAVELFHDLEHEAEHELRHPRDLSGADNIVKKHIDGLAIAFFVLIALFLAGVIVLIAIH